MGRLLALLALVLGWLVLSRWWSGRNGSARGPSGMGRAGADASAALNEAYRRGLADGERAVRAGLEAQRAAEQRAANQAGYRAGAAATTVGAAGVAGGGGRPASGRPTSRAEALAILGLPGDATAAAVEERYRELRAAGHPDAVRSKRLPAAVVAFAEEHFKLVGEAYDLLRR